MLPKLALLALLYGLAMTALQRFDAPPPMPLVDATVTHADYERCVMVVGPNPLDSPAPGQLRVGRPYNNRGFA